MGDKARHKLFVETLPGTARDRLEDARALLKAGRWSGAAYMSGYAVELGLKWKMCQALNWKEYPEAGLENKLVAALKTHDLIELSVLAGVSAGIKDSESVFPHWNIISKWGSEQRYQPKDMTTEDQAMTDVEAAGAVLDYLLDA